MLEQVLRVTLNLLLFRAGPQDFPYAPGLGRWIVIPAIVAHAAIFVTVIGGGLALVLGAVVVGSIAITARVILNLRGLGNRFQQTSHALLASSSVLVLLLALPFAQIAPILLELARMSPEQLERMSQPPELPAGPALALNILNLWSFAVTVNIYRHAADVRVLPAVLLGIVAAIVTAMLTLFGAQLAVVLLGGAR